jgi:hypothetical protein
MRSALLAATLSLVAWVPRQGEATSHAEALRTRAFEAAYNLDHDQAVALFTQALAEAPDDIAAHRGVATVQWLEITFARGTISVDEFLGDAAPAGSFPPPSPDWARAFRDHTARALEARRSASTRATPRPGRPLPARGGDRLVRVVHGNDRGTHLRGVPRGAARVRRA